MPLSAPADIVEGLNLTNRSRLSHGVERLLIARSRVFFAAKFERASGKTLASSKKRGVCSLAYRCPHNLTAAKQTSSCIAARARKQPRIPAPRAAIVPAVGCRLRAAVANYPRQPCLPLTNPKAR